MSWLPISTQTLALYAQFLSQTFKSTSSIKNYICEARTQTSLKMNGKIKPTLSKTSLPHHPTNIVSRCISLIQLGIWRVPWRTHNNMLPHLAGMIYPELWFAKRCIKFISMFMKSDNNTISMMGANGLYYVLGANYRVLCTKYGMNLNNIMKVWNDRCANEEDIIRKCEKSGNCVR